MTDAMLVRMVVVLLKDVSKLGPYIGRLKNIAASPDHPVFADPDVIDPALSAIARDQRVAQVTAFAGLLEILIVSQAAGMKRIKKHKEGDAVAKAMENLGL